MALFSWSFISKNRRLAGGPEFVFLSPMPLKHTSRKGLYGQIQLGNSVHPIHPLYTLVSWGATKHTSTFQNSDNKVIQNLVLLCLTQGFLNVSSRSSHFFKWNIHLKDKLQEILWVVYLAISITAWGIYLKCLAGSLPPPFSSKEEDCDFRCQRDFKCFLERQRSPRWREFSGMSWKALIKPALSFVLLDSFSLSLSFYPLLTPFSLL